MKARVRRGKYVEEDLMVAELNDSKLDWCKHEQNFIVKEKYFEKKN